MANYKCIPFLQSESWKGPFLNCNCKSYFEVCQNLKELSLTLDWVACEVHQLLVYRLDSWFRGVPAQ